MPAPVEQPVEPPVAARRPSSRSRAPDAPAAPPKKKSRRVTRTVVVGAPDEAPAAAAAPERRGSARRRRGARARRVAGAASRSPPRLRRVAAAPGPAPPPPRSRHPSRFLRRSSRPRPRSSDEEAEGAATLDVLAELAATTQAVEPRRARERHDEHHLHRFALRHDGAPLPGAGPERRPAAPPPRPGQHGLARGDLGGRPPRRRRGRRRRPRPCRTPDRRAGGADSRPQRPRRVGRAAGAVVAAAVTRATEDAGRQDEGPSRRRQSTRSPTTRLADDQAADDQVEADEDDENEASDEGTAGAPRRRRRRGGRGRRSRPESGGAAEDADESEDESDEGAEGDTESDAEDAAGEGDGSSRRRRRRRRGSSRGDSGDQGEARPARTRAPSDEVTALRGSTRLEAKRQRRRDGRDAGRRRQIITESEFLARRESVDRSMIVREKNARTQIAVLEDGVLVEHYVSNQAQSSMVGNVYLGRVQNVLPSMEAAFVDVGKGRNAVLYAGEVNWDAAGLEGGSARRIEQALKSGDPVLVQVTKDPIGHKGARLTSQVTLAGRYLVYVPGGGMTGISRKLPDTERNRLKKILREVVPDSAGVIVRTAAEGASEDELRADIARLQGQWEAIEKKSKTASAPALLQGEPDMAIRVVRDIFNDDFSSLVVEGADAWSTISSYIDELAPDLAQKVSRWESDADVFAEHRIDEQLAKGMDRKVWLPSGGSLVIDRTEAMTVVDVNTGKFTGSGGTLEETVTRNNLEAAEEIVRQLRLRDIGGIIVIDFIDMVLESNRDLVLRRLVECLGRDRTKHQVAEVTSLGLVQMTRKRVGQGLVEAFSETCEHCHGRGFIVHEEPIEKNNQRPDAGAQQQPAATAADGEAKRSRRKRGGAKEPVAHVPHAGVPVLPEAREAVKATLATIAAAAAHAHEHEHEHHAPAAVEPRSTVGARALPVSTCSPSSPASKPAAEPESDGVVEELELTAVPADVFEADGTDDEPTTSPRTPSPRTTPRPSRTDDERSCRSADRHERLVAWRRAARRRPGPPCARATARGAAGTPRPRAGGSAIAPARPSCATRRGPTPSARCCRTATGRRVPGWTSWSPR